MERKYRDHIKRYLVELCTTTICHPQLISRLTSQEILGDIDKQSLELPMLTPFEKSKRFYEILETRSHSYHKLMLALKETKQTGALEILAQQCSSIIQKTFVHGDLNAEDENGDCALFTAIRSGAMLSEIKVILLLGANPKIKNRHGQTVLHRAAEAGALPAIKYFLLLGVDIMSRDNFQNTVLHHLIKAQKNFLETLHYFIRKKVNINAINSHGQTLLLLSAMWGRTKLELEAIISLGGNWKIKDSKGGSILPHVIEQGNVEALCYFISLGADVNETDSDNNSLIHLVAYAKGHFKEILKVLLENNLDINLEDNDGDTLLFLAAANGRSKDDLEHVFKLGGIWDRTNKFGFTVLHLAVEGGNVEAIQYFVSLGVNLYARDTCNSTVMHHAAHSRNNFTDIFKYLIEQDCDVNAINNDGDNLLMLAAYLGRSREDIQIIIDAGGDWSITNKFGLTILHLAVEGGNIDVIQYLLTLGADINITDNNGNNPLHHAAYAKQQFEKIVQVFLKMGLDINRTNNDGNTLLHFSVEFGRMKNELEMIINFGGNWKHTNNLGQSVLHQAAKGGDVEALKYFISLGADINCKDNVDTNVLHMIAHTTQHFKQIQEYLVEKIDINAVDKYGNNLVLLAARWGRSKYELETIVSFGGDWKQKNHFGRSALHLAAQGANLEAIKYIISLGADILSKDNCKQTVLHRVGKAEQFLKQALKFLLAKNLDINAIDIDGDNLVLLAAFWGRSKEELETIVNFGGDWKLKNNLGHTVLYRAAQGGNTEALKYFISLGVDINCRDDYNKETPLHRLRFASQNFMETIDVLVSHGADLNAIANGLTLLQMLQKDGNDRNILLLKNSLQAFCP